MASFKRLRFLHALVFSGWTASKIFSVEEILRNAWSGYYLLLIALMQVECQRGKKWPVSFLPKPTMINLLKMLSHLIVRSVSWPKHLTFEPQMTMEDSIEYFFGRVKSQKRGQSAGTLDTAGSIHACQLLHLWQTQRYPKAGSGTRSLDFVLGFIGSGLVHVFSIRMSCSRSACD